MGTSSSSAIRNGRPSFSFTGTSTGAAGAAGTGEAATATGGGGGAAAAGCTAGVVVATTGGGAGVLDLLGRGTGAVAGGPEGAAATVGAGTGAGAGAVGGAGCTVATGGGVAGADPACCVRHHNPATAKATTPAQARPIQTIFLLPFLRTALETGAEGATAAAGTSESNRSLRLFSAAATSVVDCQRSAGLFRRQRAMMASNSAGTSGAISLIGFTSSRSTADSVEMPESPSKARCPVTIS